MKRLVSSATFARPVNIGKHKHKGPGQWTPSYVPIDEAFTTPKGCSTESIILNHLSRVVPCSITLEFTGPWFLHSFPWACWHSSSTKCFLFLCFLSLLPSQFYLHNSTANFLLHFVFSILLSAQECFYKWISALIHLLEWLLLRCVWESSCSTL